MMVLGLGFLFYFVNVLNKPPPDPRAGQRLDVLEAYNNDKISEAEFFNLYYSVPPKPDYRPQILFASTLFVGSSWYLLSQLIKASHIRRLFKTRNYLSAGSTGTKIVKSAIGEELNRADLVRLIKRRPKWQIYDTTFHLYDELDLGNQQEAYYTVFEAQLRRRLPHLLFDSKQAKKRQFRHLYRQAQELSLEGGINDYFDVYAPDYYDIDVLSFITPEVIVAILAMRDYDLELIDDGLLCYAPLLSSAEIKVFQQRCLHLFNHLDDNLSAYRDDRLKGKARRERVSPFARKLLQDPKPYLFYMLGSAPIASAALAIHIHLAVSEQLWQLAALVLINPFFMVPMTTFVLAGSQFIHLRQANRRAQERFLGIELEPWPPS